MRECEHEDVRLLRSAGLVKNRGQIVKKKSHQSSEKSPNSHQIYGTVLDFDLTYGRCYEDDVYARWDPWCRYITVISTISDILYS